MSQFGVILALIFSLVIAVFAIANNQPIVVNYLYGKTEISAVVVILGAAILGALVMFLLNIFKQIKTGFRLRNLQGQVNDLSARVDELTGERDALLVQIGQLQEQDGLEKEKVAEQSTEEPSEPSGEPYVAPYFMQETGEEHTSKDEEDAPADASVSDPAADEDRFTDQVEEEEQGMTDKKDEKKF